MNTTTVSGRAFAQPVGSRTRGNTPVGVCDAAVAHRAAASAVAPSSGSDHGRARISVRVHAEGSASQRQCPAAQQERGRRDIGDAGSRDCCSAASGLEPADRGTVPGPGGALSRAWRPRRRASEFQPRDRAESARRRGVRRPGAGLARLGPPRTRSRRRAPRRLLCATVGIGSEHIRHDHAGARPA